jgi:putative aldouronate transport system permease protein
LTATAHQAKAKRVKGRRLKNFLYDLRKNPLLLLMLVPGIVFFFIFSYLPMIGIYYAFTRYDFSGGLFGSPFVGLENFRFLFASGTALNITVNTIFYNTIFIVGGNTSQAAVAILLSKVSGRYFRKTSQTIMFLPYFISYVIVGTFAYNILNYDTGFINNMLVSLGMAKYDFFNTAWIWRLLIPIFHFWKNIGYGSVIYLAAIMGISEEYYEAASIDGAGVMQQIRYITIPCLKPTFVILLLLAVGNILRGQFDLFFQLTGKNGLLFSATEILDTYVFRSLRFNTGSIGMGAAAGLYQSFVGMFIVFFANWGVRRIEPDMSLF